MTTTKKALLIALPTAALALGGVGIAFAATPGSQGPTPAPSGCHVTQDAMTARHTDPSCTDSKATPASVRLHQREHSMTLTAAREHAKAGQCRDHADHAEHADHGMPDGAMHDQQDAGQHGGNDHGMPDQHDAG